MKKLNWKSDQKRRRELKHEARVRKREAKRVERLATYSEVGVGEVTVDLKELLVEAEGKELVVRVAAGSILGTCWTTVTRQYGTSRVEVISTGEKCMLREMIGKGRNGSDLKELTRTGGVMKIEVCTPKGVDREEVKSLMRWSKRKGEWQRDKPDADLEKLYSWDGLVSFVGDNMRRFVRERLQKRVKKLGGEVVPKQVIVRLPAKCCMCNRDIRAWWVKMVAKEKAHLPAGMIHRWKAALRVVQALRVVIPLPPKWRFLPASRL